MNTHRYLYCNRICLFIAVVVACSPRLTADPLGEQVVAGQATFKRAGNMLTVEQQSGAAVINWTDFSIGANQLTRFIQPGLNSAVLNRVLGADPSLINGQLQANGSVFLINPNGILVGPQGRIDVGAFYASTLDVADDDFLNGGDLSFFGASRAGVRNLGSIKATEGDVMLIAYTVRNAGTIEAPKGVAGLAAGSEVLLTHEGDQRIVVKSGLLADGLETGVENTGLLKAAQAELKAAGGSIYELAVNHSGVVRATGVEMKNGRVILTAEGGAVKVGGNVSAQNANGSGGEILVGGGYQGKNPDVANAMLTLVSGTATLDVSATPANGNGGKVVVWADGVTQFSGGIAARAGDLGGNGGQVEVSGKRYLEFHGLVDTTAKSGRRGSLLLDPDSVVISGDATPANDFFNLGFSSERFIVAQQQPSTLNAAELSGYLENSDVFVMASNYGGQFGGPSPSGFYGITVNADLAWSAASTLQLISGDTIALHGSITAPSGRLTLAAGSRSTTSGTAGTISLDSTKSITVNALDITMNDSADDRAPDSTDIGTVNLAGTVMADTLSLMATDISFQPGVQGDVLIQNPNNRIGTLLGSNDPSVITGDLKIVDGADGLEIKWDWTGVAGALEIVTTGNLTLASSAKVANTGPAIWCWLRAAAVSTMMPMPMLSWRRAVDGISSTQTLRTTPSLAA